MLLSAIAFISGTDEMFTKKTLLTLTAGYESVCKEVKVSGLAYFSVEGQDSTSDMRFSRQVCLQRSYGLASTAKNPLISSDPQVVSFSHSATPTRYHTSTTRNML
jgi:hypothetical protein